MKRIIIGLAAAFLLATAANAMEPAKTMDTSLGKVLVDADKGMTLYTYKPDGVGAKVSTCTGKCIVNWPPFLASADAKAEGDWTIVEVTDKDGKPAKMWAYDGTPLYFFIKDAKPGDTM